jgi:hypothetical protein
METYTESLGVMGNRHGFSVCGASVVNFCIRKHDFDFSSTPACKFHKECNYSISLKQRVECPAIFLSACNLRQCLFVAFLVV